MAVLRRVHWIDRASWWLHLARPEDCLGHASISYIERVSSPALRWAVEALWSLKGHLVGEAAAIPKPYVELVVSLADSHWWRSDERTTSFRDGWITPIQTGPRYSRAAGMTRFVAARLRPEAATLLFGTLPVGDGGPPIPAEAVIGAGFGHVRDLLATAPTARASLDLFEAWLAERLPAQFSTLITAMPGEPWRADVLSRHLGLNERAARRRFEATLGCSPKYWLRLHRLSAVLARPAFQQGTETLAATAARFGLADQAHLAREFRLLAGMPPSAYQRRRETEGLRVAPTMAPSQ